ncbi:MAG: HTH-type transcriptional regulator, sugar sensing transcriptional regulator [Patescibacteria group bacterium]|nr:HTH-type transcriptional regulator, sugar sensing transcriptional regulator [Patescibacteria group bacterium]
MELFEALKHLGLNEKQAKVYVALLQMGSGSVPAISIKAGTKRPTTYLLLEELRMKGLVTLLPKKVKAIYTAQSPQRLLEEHEEKQEIIQQNLPELMAIYNSQKEKPKVVYYQGEENVAKLWDEIFKEKEILFYGSIGRITPGVLRQVNKYLNVVKKEKVLIREILQGDEKSIEFAKTNASENHQFKIAPNERMLPTDNVIFGNKVGIISYKDTPMAVVIESGDVVATYRSMFEMVWSSIERENYLNFSSVDGSV